MNMLAPSQTSESTSVPGPSRTKGIRDAVARQVASLDPWVREIGYHFGMTLDARNRLVNIELLARKSGIPTGKVIADSITRGNSFQLFLLGFTKAFGWNGRSLYPGCTFSVNAHLSDIQSSVFQEEILRIMAQFKRGDCKKIIIEIVETPHGQIDAVSMKNIGWLIEMGFQIAIDDLTLIPEDITNENISRGIFDALKGQCKRIKFDHLTTRAIINDDDKYRQALLEFRRKYPDVHITVEGIHNHTDIERIEMVFQEYNTENEVALKSVDAFQFYNGSQDIVLH